jgi:hypothetical protein
MSTMLIPITVSKYRLTVTYALLIVVLAIALGVLL